MAWYTEGAQAQDSLRYRTLPAPSGVHQRNSGLARPVSGARAVARPEDIFEWLIEGGTNASGFPNQTHVTKPFSPRELRARIKAVLRRFSPPTQETFRFGDVEVDFARAEVRRDGKAVEMTPIEFKLL